MEGASAQTVSFEVRSGDQVVFRESAHISDGLARVDFRVGDVKLWYPHGYGEQPLYTVTATASVDGINLHQATRRTGFRKGELVQEPDEVGKTFFFRVNGVDVFCGGSDWIPADSFTPRVSEERYRKWLELMVDGYQVMIRSASYSLTCSVANRLSASGEAASGRKTSSTTSATNSAFSCGKTSCLAAATTRLSPPFSTRSRRNV